MDTIKRHEDEIDLGIYWALIVEKKWLIAAITLVIVGIAVFYAMVATPIYRTDAMLQLETKNVGALGDISKLLQNENEETLAELEIIRSRQVIGKVVEKLNLDIKPKPHYFPIIGAAIARRYQESEKTREPLWELSQYAWGGERFEIADLTVSELYENKTLKLIAGENNQYQLYDAENNFLLNGIVGQLAKTDSVEIMVAELHARPGTAFFVTKQSHSLAVLYLQGRLKASEKSRQTGVLQVSIEGSEPEKITQIINTIAQVYVQQNVERKLQKVERMLNFVSSRLPTLKANLEAAEAKLIAHYKKYGSVNIDLENRTLLSQLSEIEKQISSWELLQIEYKRQYTRKNPYLISLEKQLNNLKYKRSQLNKRINKLPNAEINLTKVMRDVKIASEVYSLLLEKEQELNLAKAGILGNVYIVDPAIIPTEAVKPKKHLIIAGGVSFGLFVGLFLVFVRQAMQKGISSANIIEQRLNLPILAIVPHSEKQAQLTRIRRKVELFEQATTKIKGVTAEHQVLAIHEPRDSAIESLRRLRTSLLFALMDKQFITITSPTQEVGKAFISVNLSHLFANAGKRVLLIDGNMRNGHLHHLLVREISPGLSDVINGECELEEAIQNPGDEAPSMSFLPAGTYPPNPSELLMHDRFQELLETISKQFDLIIIDTPPIIAVTDATIIGHLAGGTNFMVVHAEQQMLQEVELSLKLFERLFWKK